MSGHFEHSHYSENSQNLADLLDRVQLVHERREVVGKNGEEVNDVHEALDELTVVRAGEEPDDELDGEPGHVDGLQDVDHRVGI